MEALLQIGDTLAPLRQGSALHHPRFGQQAAVQPGFGALSQLSWRTAIGWGIVHLQGTPLAALWSNLWGGGQLGKAALAAEGALLASCGMMI